LEKQFETDALSLSLWVTRWHNLPISQVSNRLGNRFCNWVPDSCQA